MKPGRSEPTPKLCFWGGEWMLETHELVAVDRDIYRPAKRRVHGAEAIVSHLKRSGADPALREATIQLLKSRRDEEGWYELVDGEWISAALASKLKPEDATDPAIDSVLQELRAELLVLRASHRTLKERVVQVEARIREEYADTPPEPEPPPEVPEPAVLRREPGEAKAEAAAPAPAPDESSAGESIEEAAFTHATLPTKNAIVASLKQLLGTDPGLELAMKAPPESSAAQGLLASVLSDAGGRELGVILANVRAVAELGGGLLGLGAPQIEQQVQKGAASEDAIAAMNEFCNTLSAAVNRASSGVQVHAEPLGPYPSGRMAWLPQAEKSCVLTNKSAAELWLVTR